MWVSSYKNMSRALEMLELILTKVSIGLQKGDIHEGEYGLQKGEYWISRRWVSRFRKVSIHLQEGEYDDLERWVLAFTKVRIDI